MTREQTLRRYELVSAYLNNQTDEAWDALKRAIAEEHFTLVSQFRSVTVQPKMSADGKSFRLEIDGKDYPVSLDLNADQLQVCVWPTSGVDDPEINVTLVGY